MARRIFPLLLVAALAAFTRAEYVEGDGSDSASPQLLPGAYVVMLKAPAALEAPIAAAAAEAYPRYRARAAGLAPATAEAARTTVEDFSAQQRSVQADVFAAALAAAPSAPGAPSAGPQAEGVTGPSIAHHYTLASNGFAAVGLSEAQAAALRSDRRVATVSPARVLRKATFSTPRFLGLDGPSGVWQTQFGGISNAGAGVLVGMVDTGTTPSAPTMASISQNKVWPGLGPGSPACSEANTCTDGKLIGCKKFSDVIKQGNIVLDGNTCVDGDGHGTHTSSTAAGAYGATAVYDGDVLGKFSGMAPAAAIASYKVLFNIVQPNGQQGNSGTDADIIKAIDDAVKDNVDIISYSIGSTPTAPLAQNDITMTAFRNAAAAGVFISAAGGNSGPTVGTVDNSAPWITTVAAGTHPTQMVANLTLSGAPGLPGPIIGVSATKTGAGPAAVWYAPDLKSAEPLALCKPGTLSSADVAGKIVLCKRGIYARVDKSAEVKRAGGIGMILFNVAGGDSTLIADDHSVPTVHITANDGAAVVAAYRSAPTTLRAFISASVLGPFLEAPFVAGFSSRGPLIGERGAIIKPDVLAPGVNIYAPTLPPSNASVTDGEFLSGTSMATPHVSGVAALLIARYPSWSPAAVRSALITTAQQVTNRGNPIPGTPFDFGAGLIDPAAAFNPGLVYDANGDDYFRYLCLALSKAPPNKQKGVPVAKPPAECEAACGPLGCVKAYSQGLRDINYPSFSLPQLVPRKLFTASRTVTYVGSGPATFTPTISVASGWTVTVAPPTLSFMSYGDTANFTLSVVFQPTVPRGWSFASLTWSGAGYTVRSPIALERM